MKRSLRIGVVLLCGALPLMAAQAGWRDFLDRLPGLSPEGSTAASGSASLSQSEMARGLKEALEKGIQHAVSRLGRSGGFLDDARVRIPMPKQLQWVERSLRAVGQERLADQFVTSMNRAAEQAVPAAAGVFRDAARAMTLKDARAIVTGPQDAATRYFRSHTEAQLTERMLPIVRRATARVGVTADYKRLMEAAGPLAGYLGRDTVDLDSYVTHRALDGLFLKIAEEEKQIRENPAARTTALLKKVFSTDAK
ncbi:MAG: DUF4197 domain-containing protein [Gammaproteobacteria bacterium]